MKATAIIPVKRLDSAKQRLASSLSPSQRRRLVEAMFRDTIEAVNKARQVGRVIVVSADRNVSRIARDAGATTIADPPEAGHSRATMLGIAACGEEPVIVLSGDCPLLDPKEIDSLLTGLPQPFAIVVPDRHGTGTNALVLNPGDVIEPAFGEGSCKRHVAAARKAGIPHAVEVVHSLGLDMDTPADIVALARAFEAGEADSRGRHTAKELGI